MSNNDIVELVLSPSYDQIEVLHCKLQSVNIFFNLGQTRSDKSKDLTFPEYTRCTLTFPLAPNGSYNNSMRFVAWTSSDAGNIIFFVFYLPS